MLEKKLPKKLVWSILSAIILFSFILLVKASFKPDRFDGEGSRLSARQKQTASKPIQSSAINKPWVKWFPLPEAEKKKVVLQTYRSSAMKDSWSGPKWNENTANVAFIKAQTEFDVMKSKKPTPPAQITIQDVILSGFENLGWIKN